MSATMLRAAGAAAMQGARRRASAPSIQYLADWGGIGYARTGEAAADAPVAGSWAWYDLATPWPGTDVRRRTPDGGILIENARTQLDTASRDITTWTGSNAGVTANQADGPDGSSLEADLVEASSASSPKITKATGVSAGALTASVWVKRATYSGNVTLAFSGGSTASKTVALTDSWQRVSVSAATLSGATTVELQLAADAGADVLVWGSQIEQAKFPSSDIRSASGTVTRNRDDADVLGGANIDPDFFSVGFEVDLRPLWAPSEHSESLARIFGDDADTLRFTTSSGQLNFIISGAVHASITPSPIFTRYDKVTVRIEFNNTISVKVNDVDAGSASIAGDGTWSGLAADNWALGRRGTSRLAQCLIGRPRALV